MGETIAVVGAGSWATALSIQLAKNGHYVKMWGRNTLAVDEINNNRENKKYLPGVTIPDNVRCTTDLEEAVSGSRVVLYGVPSHTFREVLKNTLPFLAKDSTVINAAKGIEENSLKRMSEVFVEETGSREKSRYVTLSGPSHAEEVGRDIPTALVAASWDIKRAEYVQGLFMSDSMRVYTNTDVVGVELGGSLKNIIALGTGIADGLGFGDNTKAALMTRGLAEMTRLGKAMGASPLTFAGLTGVGDLIVTCTSMHSRNRRAGIEIGRGKSLEEAVKSVRMVVEGVRTTKAAKKLAAVHEVEMPITEQTYNVLFKGFSAREAVMNLMGRDSKPELEEVALVNWPI
ncbi:glycerol-3-phosphate dehydrogenase (NAD(P)+) [Desulfohalotomaculum tongense]|uniref:NAD(P)H-dependent glycerol-3-phosphate dehydrogenase n=1 Tax=Desulforadius tongensis TaxID=1216062 RepID=UPI0019599B13|nr:NAD(P)H-dependent glycerol-3-phosphate dehydrogenase [Desulforadius tongensis]MBM7854631.1 glycerol-3-phosphate dehydrogenase (NAD(P)+) [Desulforadius tongensis]